MTANEDTYNTVDNSCGLEARKANSVLLLALDSNSLTCFYLSFLTRFLLPFAMHFLLFLQWIDARNYNCTVHCSQRGQSLGEQPTNGRCQEQTRFAQECRSTTKATARTAPERKGCAVSPASHQRFLVAIAHPPGLCRVRGFFRELWENDGRPVHVSIVRPPIEQI